MARGSVAQSRQKQATGAVCWPSSPSTREGTEQDLDTIQTIDAARAVRGQNNCLDPREMEDGLPTMDDFDLWRSFGHL